MSQKKVMKETGKTNKTQQQSLHGNDHCLKKASLEINPPPQRMVTSSSDEVGWMATHESNWACHKEKKNEGGGWNRSTNACMVEIPVCCCLYCCWGSEVALAPVCLANTSLSRVQELWHFDVNVAIGLTC